MYLLSVIVGTQIGYIIGLILSTETKLDKIIIYTSAIGIMVAISVITTRIRQKVIYNNFRELYKVNKNNFVSQCRHQISSTSDKILKIKLSLLLCNFFIEERDFISAKKALDFLCRKHSDKFILDELFLPGRYKLEFCLNEIYLNTKNNDLLSAYSTYSKGRKLLKKFMLLPKYRIRILSILCEYEYARGDYIKAMDYITQAIDSTHDESDKDKRRIILAKILYHMERYQDSELLLEQIIQNNSSEDNVKIATHILLQKSV